jgi:hypothetical protein
VIVNRITFDVDLAARLMEGLVKAGLRHS